MSNVPWLTGPQPDGNPGRWYLDQAECLIGREPSADLVIPLPQISRHHARIHCLELNCYLTDLDSRNGTLVNGEPVGQTPRRLQDGDRIALGNVATFHFHDPDETASAPARLPGVRLDEAERAVWVDGQRLEPPLSAAQFTLLALLYHAAGEVVRREEIIAAVWPAEDPTGVSKEALDSLIKRLRKRLQQAQVGPERSRYIELLRGYGARLVQPEAAPD